MSDDSVAQDLIRSYFDRWESLEAEKDAISADLKELFAEAKAMGFDTKVLRVVFRDKTKDQSERNEFEAVYDLYWSALGTNVATGAHLAQEIPEHDADGVIIEPAETPKETQGRASTNDEPSPEAGPQAQASHSQGTGAGTLADREARSTGEAASADLPTHSEPASVPPVLPTVVAEAGDRDRAGSPPAAVSVVASNVTAFRTHNPETHFLNSKGLMRLHGCLNAEVCAGSRSKLCFSCSVQHEGPAHQETGAA